VVATLTRETIGYGEEPDALVVANRRRRHTGPGGHLADCEFREFVHRADALT
jgi:hypothetical protein